jgi:hypothetical protein
MIAYGAQCVWWDDKGQVSTLESGLPCCPFCRRVLFEIEEDKWWSQADEYAKTTLGREDYLEFLIWLQGKDCRELGNWQQAYNKWKETKDESNSNS